MPAALCLSVRFLDGEFHGRRDGGAPEWPPSPLRAYQALAAAAAARWPEPDFSAIAAPALRWLANLPPPTITAPSAVVGQPYRLSVPNNAMDIVARAWSRGNLFGSGDANPATHRALKTVQPLRPATDTPICYAWRIPDGPSDEIRGFLETISVAARHMVALGWGIDLVAAEARVLPLEAIAALGGERWSPTEDAATPLRVPSADILAALKDRHAAFLRRCTDGGFTPVPPLSAAGFRQQGYRRDFEPPARPVAAFQLLRPDASGFRPFETRRGCVVAGMLRHCAAMAATEAQWPPARVGEVVLGHAETDGAPPRAPQGQRRFAYLPLPSLEGRGAGQARVVGSIRRALVTSFNDGVGAETAWARRALSGRDLIDAATKTPAALLALIPADDKLVRCYVAPSATWSSVAPVILPGRDDRDARKTERLLRKAIVQAGFAPALARHAVLEWRNVAFWRGADLATRYFVPEHLRRYPRLHVRIEWRDPAGQPLAIPGPICLGGGRFFGLGLLASSD